MKFILLLSIFILSSCAIKGYKPEKGVYSTYCKSTTMKSSEEIKKEGMFESEAKCKESEEFKTMTKELNKSREYVIANYKQSFVSCNQRRYMSDETYNIMNEKGFETKISCTSSKEFKDAEKELKRLRKRKITAANRKRVQKIKAWVKSNPKYKKFERTAIEKKISIGMPEKLLHLSWGRPDKVNKTVSRYGTRKQNIYGNRQYVYTKNGLITSWQN